ncbi:hypothetical protein A2U01_0069726, partial [Trifolium medium]|nr:hypothetical protein [Trifolium medium]
TKQFYPSVFTVIQSNYNTWTMLNELSLPIVPFGEKKTVPLDTKSAAGNLAGPP